VGAFISVIVTGAGCIASTRSASLSTPDNSPFTVTITEPHERAPVTAGVVVVRGGVQTGGTGIEVVLNDVPTAIEGAGNSGGVRMSSDATNLEPAAIQPAQATGDANVPTRVTGTLESATILRPTPPGGVAPLTVAFSLSELRPGGTVELDFDGDGTTDFRGATVDAPLFTYTRAGIYLPTARLTDASGTTIIVTTLIHVYDRGALEALLQTKWLAFLDALRRTDRDAMAELLHSDSRADYREHFNRISARGLRTIAWLLTGPFRLVDVGSGQALYEVLWNQEGYTLPFTGSFEIDHDGIWRLRELSRESASAGTSGRR